MPATQTAKFYVRLKPHDPVRGQLAQRYIVREMLFENMRGGKPYVRWFEVDAQTAEALRKCRQDDRGMGATVPAFDICTRAEAEAIQAEEQRRAFEEKAGIKLQRKRGLNGSDEDVVPDTTPIRARPVEIGTRQKVAEELEPEEPEEDVAARARPVMGRRHSVSDVSRSPRRAAV